MRTGKRAKTEFLIRGWVEWNKDYGIYQCLPEAFKSRDAAMKYCNCGGERAWAKLSDCL